MINFAPYFMVHFIINLRLFVEMMGLSDSIAYLPMAAISAVTNYLVIRTVVKYSKRASKARSETNKPH